MVHPHNGSRDLLYGWPAPSAEAVAAPQVTADNELAAGGLYAVMTEADLEYANREARRAMSLAMDGVY